MCVLTLDLKHPEEKYSLVRGWIFFFHPTFSRPQWHEISQWHRDG